MSKEANGCWIYKITNVVNGKVYVGRTVRCVKRRFSEHLNLNAKGSTYLKRSIKKYGSENFKVEDIFFCFNNFEIFEAYFIKLHNCINPNGYNAVILDKTNRRMCTETRMKMSEAKKGVIPWNKNKKGKQKAWNKGVLNLTAAKAVTRVCINTGKTKNYESGMEAVREGFNSGHITACCKKRLKQHKGYKWFYTEEYISE